MIREVTFGVRSFPVPDGVVCRPWMIHEGLSHGTRSGAVLFPL